MKQVIPPVKRKKDNRETTEVSEILDVAEDTSTEITESELETIRARHILVETKEEAEEVLKKLKDGSRFYGNGRRILKLPLFC